jgi:hypothetical protein
MEKRGGGTRLISVVVCVALIALVVVALAGAASAQGQDYNEGPDSTVRGTRLENPDEVAGNPDEVTGPRTAQPETGGLPFTGAHAVLTTLIGSGLIVVGLTVVRASRRRRTSQPQ